MIFDNESELSPILLTDGAWLGTLAAARDLGSRGVPVTLATSTRFAPARWSRHVRSTVLAPPTDDRPAFLQWLLEFGARHPGHVLYPTSDNLAWLMAVHADDLREASFKVFALDAGALLELLDKARLNQHAREAGFQTPETRVPTNEHELVAAARELGYPLFIKPRLQLFGAGSTKGKLVCCQQELVAAWQSIRHGIRHDANVLAAAPDIDIPMVQACTRNSERIYTLDGYFDAASGQHTIIGCTKVLQLPRGSGPGVIFEHSEVPGQLRMALESMFQNIGYSGVYDVEFLEDEGNSRLLIDINPRFYNHMAFEVERGVPLPWLAYLAASGRSSELVQAIADVSCRSGGPVAYVHPLPTRLLLLCQRLSGVMSREQGRHWQSLMASYDGSVTNPIRTPGDPGPEILEIALLAQSFLRHPRGFLRGLFHSPGATPESPRGDQLDSAAGNPTRRQKPAHNQTRGWLEGGLQVSGNTARLRALVQEVHQSGGRAPSDGNL